MAVICGVKYALLLTLVILSIDNYVSYGSFPYRYCSKNETSCLNNIDIVAKTLRSDKYISSKIYLKDIFCAISNEDGGKKSNVYLNFGQKFFGETIERLPYSFEFSKDQTCTESCFRTLPTNDLKKHYADLIKKNYKNNFYIDGLPVLGFSQEKNVYLPGLELGCPILDLSENAKDASNYSLGNLFKKEIKDTDFNACDYNLKDPKLFKIFNHINYVVEYIDDKSRKDDGKIITAINADLFSVKNMDDCKKVTGKNGFSDLILSLKDDKKFDVTYSYSVDFKYIKNGSIKDRNKFWETVMNYNSKFSTLTFVLMTSSIVCLAIFLGALFYRFVKRDIIKYTRLLENVNLDIQDEYGWKLLQGDVFRPPKYPMILATSVGSGLQLTLMVIASLFLAAIGFFAEQYSSAIITSVIVFYVLFGILSGYVSARLYKFFGGIHWKTCVLTTTFLHPGIIFFMVIFTNIWLVAYKFPNAMKFSAIGGAFGLWITISVPLTFVGAYFGFRKQVIHTPCRINHIPRFIPHQKFFVSRTFSFLFGGLPAFGCLYFQLYMLIKGIWLNVHYIMLGSLFFISLLTIIISCEIAILLAYLHLSSEDYRWQWRSFFTTASTAVSCFIVVIVYYRNHFKESSAFGGYIYFGYSLIVFYLSFLAFGSIGFLSCFLTIKKMYSSIKAD